VHILHIFQQHDISIAVSHNAALDSVVSNVKTYLNSLKSNKRQAAATRTFLDGLNNLFSSTVNSLKQVNLFNTFIYGDQQEYHTIC